MNTKYSLFFLLIVLVLTACSKKIIPNEGYIRITNKESVDLIKINKSNTIQLLANNNFKNKLTLNDSVLIYNDSIKSNFQKFSIELKPEKKYRIKVSSLCNCAGFKKYMFIPLISPINKKDTFFTKLDSTYFNYEKGPLTLNRIWNVKSDNITENTKFDFLLYSDNSNLSEKVYKFVTNTSGIVNNVFIPIAIPINIKSTLIGKFVVKVEEF